MEQITVKKTVDGGLCTPCGACAGVCPKNCICWERDKGLYLPHINPEQCVSCGLCASVCPGLGHTYETKRSPKETVTGEYLECCNAWSRDPQVRHISASGGVVTTLVKTLLEQGIYNSVFCLDTYDYRNRLETKRKTGDTFFPDAETAAVPKSRYLPVSHEQAVRYMKEHRQERIILIATSCALRGILAVIDRLKLNRENYLLIGLFCDKVFNYNVISYFEDRFCQGQTLTALHFKNKESGGWPGDMKLFPEKSQPIYVPIHERGRVKAYFMPERCLYCVDKLNAQADISLGDNYTGIDASELGSNSVIIRTCWGKTAWDAAREGLETRPVEIGAIRKAQYLEGRLNNLYFADLKAARLGAGTDLNRGIIREQNCEIYRQAWDVNLKKLKAGQIYDQNPKALDKQMKKDIQKPNPILSFCRRGYYFLKRKLS